MSAKKSQRFKLLLLRENLLFGTSNQISTNEKLNLLLINSICLVFSPLEMQRKLMQTTLFYKFFLLCLKRNISQTYESKQLQKVFCQLCMLLVQLDSMNFFIPYDNCRTYFFTQKVISSVLLRSLKQVF